MYKVEIVSAIAIHLINNQMNSNSVRMHKNSMHNVDNQQKAADDPGRLVEERFSSVCNGTRDVSACLVEASYLLSLMCTYFSLPERRHSSYSKLPLTPPSSSVFPLFSSSKSKGSSIGGSSRSSSGGGTSASSSSSSKLLKSPKDKLPISGNSRPIHLVHSKGPHDKM